MGWDAIPNVLDKILGHFTPAERVKRLKNELSKLEQERNTLLIHKADENKSKRLTVVCSRIATLHRLLENEANGN